MRKVVRIVVPSFFRCNVLSGNRRTGDRGFDMKTSGTSERMPWEGENKGFPHVRDLLCGGMAILFGLPLGVRSFSDGIPSQGSVYVTCSDM